MEVPSQMPLENPQQVQQWLQSMMPQYTYAIRGSYVVVGDGAATGVLIRSAGPGRAKLVWAFPSMGLQIALSVAMVLTGILPGLIAFGIVWAATSSGVDALRQQVAHALSGAMAPGAQVPMSSGPAIGSKPGGGLLAGAIIMILLGLGAFGFAASEFSDADRCDRWASERSSSYGRSNYGLGSSFWYARARTHREQGTASIGGGVFLLMLAGVMFAVRSGQIRSYNARLASAGGPMPGPHGQQGYAPQGYAPQGFAPQGGFAAPPQQNAFAQQMATPAASQQGFGQPQQPGGWPPSNQGNGGGWPQQ